MPRKVKYGILFHSRDVLFYEEIDTQKAIVYGGAEAGVIYEVLLGKIYQSGHFFKFKDFKDDLVFLFRKDFHFEDERITNAFKVLVDLGFFDKDSFEKGYITSIEIQKFYYQITKSRKITHLDECWLLSDEEMKYIETPKKQRGKKNQENNEISKDDTGTAEVYQRTTEQEEITAETMQGTQSKSNSQTHSQTETKKKKNQIKDKGDSPHLVIPSHYDGFLETMIKQDIIDVYDINNEKINDFLRETRKNHKSTILYEAVRFTYNQLKKNKWLDEDGKDVIDKYAYFRRALLNNIERAYKNEEFKNDPRPVEEKLFSGLETFKIPVKMTS